VASLCTQLAEDQTEKGLTEARTALLDVCEQAKLIGGFKGVKP
jgi:hypothetical protein